MILQAIESAPILAPLAMGVVVALITFVLAPLIKRRWDLADRITLDATSTAAARVEAADKFQGRLLVQIQELEEGSEKRNDGVCHALELRSALNELAVQVAALRREMKSKGTV